MRQKQGQKRQIPVLFGILKKYRKNDTRSDQKMKISPKSLVLLSKSDGFREWGTVDVAWTSIGQRWGVGGNGGSGRDLLWSWIFSIDLWHRSVSFTNGLVSTTRDAPPDWTRFAKHRRSISSHRSAGELLGGLGPECMKSWTQSETRTTTIKKNDAKHDRI